jgi:hypothetical protein
MDAFLETSANYEFDLGTTPYLEIQLNKWNEKEYFSKKQIPEAALFAGIGFLDKLRNFYSANLDIPLLIHGAPGCGKLTALIAMMPNCPAYFPSIDSMSNSIINDSRRIGNITYMKTLYEKDFPKLLVYENLFLINIAVLNNNTEIIEYLKQVYKIARTRSIDASRKIIVITHIDLCNRDTQRYIAFMLDKINSNTSYIFTTTKLNQLDKKIQTFCAPIAYEIPDETVFTNVFKHNYLVTGVIDKKWCSISHLKHYWNIYRNNRYNIGNTIAQIKYLASQSGGIKLDKLKLDEHSGNLLDNIASNFIKKKMKLTALSGALDIRRFIYTLLSVGIDLQVFISRVIRQLLASKISIKSKAMILAKAGEMSASIPLINKELIATELLLYQLVHIVYSGGIEP